MNITTKILSIPPYISTSWKNIVAVRVEARPYGHALVIELITGNKVEIPNLERPILERVFQIHAKYLEEEGREGSVMTSIPLPFINVEGFTGMLEHNPEQKDSPLLPAEMLEKIALMAKGVLPEGATFNEPEEGCNCPHCQIMRALITPAQQAPEQIEEEVTDEDLTFRTWDIKQESDKLYSVTNPLDHKEHYNVFLGDPLGCTCGQKSCEHIQAVLRT